MIDVKDPYNPKEIGRFGATQASHGVNDILYTFKDHNKDCRFAVDQILGMYLLGDEKNACKVKK